MKLSPTMGKCLHHAKLVGELVRHPGGYWAGANANPPKDVYYGTNTVYALLSRGLLEVTARMSRGDAWKVRATDK